MAKAIRAKEKTNYRFFFAVAMLAVIAVGLSFYTNPNSASSFWQGMPTGAVTYSDASSGSSVEMSGGINDGLVFTPNNDGQNDVMNLNFIKKPQCSYYSASMAAGTSYSRDPIIEITSPTGQIAFRTTLAYNEDTKSITLSPSWADGKYKLTVRCPEILKEVDPIYNTGTVITINGEFIISHAAYLASADYASTGSTGCGGTDKRCLPNQKCIDAAASVCERTPIIKPVTPCNKGLWLTADGGTLNQKCTGDIVYDTGKMVVPSLKWSDSHGNDETPLGILVTSTNVFALTSGHLYKFTKDGNYMGSYWSPTAVGGLSPFLGKPSIMTVTTPKNTMTITTSEGSVTTEETGRVNTVSKETKVVEFGGQKHMAVIAATNAGEIIAIDTETMTPVCDKAVVDGQDLGTESCWGPVQVGGVIGSPIVYGDSIYVDTKNGITKIAADRGQMAWTFRPNIRATYYNTGEPALDSSGNVYFGADTGRVYKLNANGVKLAESPILFQLDEKDLTSGVPVTAAPIFIKGPFVNSARDALIVYTANGKLYRLTVDDLKQFGSWSYPATGLLSTSQRSAMVTSGGVSEYLFTLLAADADGKLHYISQEGTDIWSAAASTATPLLISVTDPIRAAYYVDVTGMLSIFEVSPSGREGAPLEGKKTPIPVYNIGQTKVMPVISDDTLYAVGSKGVFAFAADYQAPSATNVKQTATIAAPPSGTTCPTAETSGETEITRAYTDEGVKLCADWKDNYGLTQAVLHVSSGNSVQTFTQNPTGTAATVCFSYNSPTAGEYKWSTEATDIGKNTERTAEKSFTLVERPKQDCVKPGIMLVDVNSRFLKPSTEPDKNVGFYEALGVNVRLDDDVELKESGALVCVSGDRYGCEPKTGFIGPTSADDPWTDLKMPTELNDPNARWEKVVAEGENWPGQDRLIYVTPDMTTFEAGGYWPQNTYVFWTMYVCDKASKYPAKDVSGKVITEQPDNCNILVPTSGTIEGSVPKFFVPDVTNPVVQGIIQDKATLKPDGTDAVTLSAEILDNVNIKKVTFTVDGLSIDYPLDKAVNGRAKLIWKTDLTKQPESQARTVDWTVTAEDLSGNTFTNDAKQITLTDIAPPSISSATPDKTRVREGDLIRINVVAKDNYRLKNLNLYVDGKVCTGNGQAQTNSKNAVVPLTCPAPTITATKKTADWYVTAVDEYGNSVQGTTGTISLAPSCGAKSTAAPQILNVVQPNTTMMPGDTMTVSAKITDDLDAATLCGGVGSVWVETQGEDGVWRFAGKAQLKNVKQQYSADEGTNKISEADAEFSITLPKYVEPLFSDFVAVMTSGNMGPLGRLGGIGLPGRIGAMGYVTATTGTAARPYATPGTQVKWRFAAVDTLAHENDPEGNVISVPDLEQPKLVSISQPNNTLIYNNKMNLSACFRDNGQVAKITFVTDETGAAVRHEFDVKGENAWTYTKLCKDYTFDATGMNPGTAVHWTAYAEDMVQLNLTSPQQDFRVISDPPVITGEKSDPSSPVQGQPVTITVSATDDLGLASAILESNETGEFKEVGNKAVSGKSADIQFTWSNPVVPAGTLVYWRMKVADLDGSIAVTDPAFTVQPDITAPTVSNPAQSKDSVVQGGTLTLRADLSDNGALALAVLETDEDGTLKNMTTKPVNGQTASVSFDWQNKNVVAGNTVKWRIYAVDVAGNTAAGPQLSFTVTEAEKTCPTCPPATQFGKCSNSLQTRTTYVCDKSTNYLCQSKDESRTCIMSPADTAFDAISAAKDAITTASGKGWDVSEAQAKLNEAEFAYAAKDYATAQADAIKAKSLAESAGTAVSPTYIIGAVLLVIAASVVAVFAKKKDILKPKAKPQKPEMPAP